MGKAIILSIGMAAILIGNAGQALGFDILKDDLVECSSTNNTFDIAFCATAGAYDTFNHYHQMLKFAPSSAPKLAGKYYDWLADLRATCEQGNPRAIALCLSNAAVGEELSLFAAEIDALYRNSSDIDADECDGCDDAYMEPPLITSEQSTMASDIAEPPSAGRSGGNGGELGAYGVAAMPVSELRSLGTEAAGEHILARCAAMMQLLYESGSWTDYNGDGLVMMIMMGGVAIESQVLINGYSEERFGQLKEQYMHDYTLFDQNNMHIATTISDGEQCSNFATGLIGGF